MRQEQRLRPNNSLSLRPNPFLFSSAIGGRHGHRTSGLRTYAAALENAGCYAQGLNFRLQSGNLRLKNSNLVFFFLNSIVKVSHSFSGPRQDRNSYIKFPKSNSTLALFFHYLTVVPVLLDHERPCTQLPIQK